MSVNLLTTFLVIWQAESSNWSSFSLYFVITLSKWSSLYLFLRKKGVMYASSSLHNKYTKLRRSNSRFICAKKLWTLFSLNSLFLSHRYHLRNDLEHYFRNYCWRRGYEQTAACQQSPITPHDINSPLICFYVDDVSLFNRKL